MISGQNFGITGRLFQSDDVTNRGISDVKLSDLDDFAIPHNQNGQRGSVFLQRFWHHAVKSLIVFKSSKRDLIKVATGIIHKFYGLFYD
jgi:hypothetical protein